MKRIIMAALLAAVSACAGIPWAGDPMGMAGRAVWSPLSLGPSLLLFLDGDSLPASGVISSWPDASTHQLSADQATPANSPSVIILNGRRAASFDGAEDFLTTVPFAVSNAVSMFVVARSDRWKYSGDYQKILSKAGPDSPTEGIAMALAGVNYTGVWELFDLLCFGSGYGSTGYPRNISPLSVTNGQTCILGTVLSSTQAGAWANGTETTARYDEVSAVPLNTFEMTIGRNSVGPSTQYLKADVLCILFIQADLETSERQKIEGWAAWRYSLQSELPADHPYKNHAP